MFDPTARCAECGRRGASCHTARLAVLERQLQRYVASTLPPARDAMQAKRRATLRLRVVRDNLRRQRALRTHYHERGWQDVPLTDEDMMRAQQLAEVDLGAWPPKR